MNYYEELGIRVDADEEEIRKAHRRLVKLMHPDQHRDQGLKQLAETQMRRLNSIVSTLLDPEERREYDDQLLGREEGASASQNTWRSIPWWIASTLGAVVLTVGAVWFWANHMGSSISRQPVEVSAPPTVEAPAKPAPVQPKQEAPPPPVVAQKEPETAPDRTIAEVPAAPSRQTEDKKTKLTPVSRPVQPPPPVESGRDKKKLNLPSTLVASARPAQSNLGNLQPPPSVLYPTRDDASISMAPLTPNIVPPKPAIRLDRDPLEGEWVYAPAEPEKHKSGFYPPEFIRLNLNKQTDGMHGQYSARYNVSDNRPISPDVNFQLKAVDKDSRKFIWTASNGSRGTLAIRSVESDTMRLEWRTTNAAGGPALTSGMATLVRRNN